MPFIRRLPPTQGAFSRLLSALILLAVFAVSLFLGAVLFLVVLGALVLLFLIVYLRLRWLRRKRKGQAPRGPGGGVILEGEYTVTKSARAKDDESP